MLPRANFKLACCRLAKTARWALLDNLPNEVVFMVHCKAKLILSQKVRVVFGVKCLCVCVYFVCNCLRLCACLICPCLRGHMCLSVCGYVGL